MKKQFPAFIAVLAIGFFFLNFTAQNESITLAADGSKFEIPDNVKQIIDNSCFGCHNIESKNDKAKKKLLFDELGELKTHKLVGKLADISDVVGEGEMPPKKAIERFPSIKLSDEDRNILKEWAAKTAEELTSK
ncbi:MAG: heme-binding domain-containing protein [Bacteroidales bacterium]|nr:heme-binding domain-containing protein [Bacteroidales bacterium]MCF6341496.1 heme-binding domain-containing protein [Bacteroidales bacterium]